MRLWLIGVLGVSLSLTLSLLNGCGGGDEKAPLSTLHTAIYTGSGSVWTWSLNESGNFTATRKATKDSAQAQLSITGTYEALPSGFLKFTVGTATSPDGSVVGGDLPAASSQAYGFAVPGVVMIVKPIGEDNGELLAMPVLTTTCPGVDVQFNWVQAATMGQAGDLTTTEFWGNALLPAAAGDLTGAKWVLGGTEQPSQTLNTHTGCVDGTYAIADGFINMTASGIGLVNLDNNDGDVVAVPRDTSITTNSLDGKTMVGLVFSEDTRGGTNPIKVTFGANGAGTFASYTDVDTGSVVGGETGSVTVTEAGTGEKAGFLKLTADPPGNEDTPTMWAAVASNLSGTGRTFLFASGVSVPAVGVADDSFSLLLVEL